MPSRKIGELGRDEKLERLDCKFVDATVVAVAIADNEHTSLGCKNCIQ